MDSDDDLDPDLNQAVLESLSSQDINGVEQETNLPETFSRESLVSLAAKVTGKHYPCVALETHDVINAEHVMKKVLLWTFPQSEQKMKMIATLNEDQSFWATGENMMNCVEEIHQVGFSISGIVKKDEKSDKSTESARVSLTFEKQRVTSTCCSVCPRVLWCRHIVAVALYRIRNPDKVPIHLPVTEVLSSLSRHQLQKVMQYAIYEDPGGLIPRLFKYINDVRNPDSELNQIDGLPDPSFGMDPDKKSTVDLSMDILRENLVKVIRDDMRWTTDKYPPSFDYFEKRKNSFYQKYFGKIKALIDNEETEIAGKLLISLASVTLEVINGVNPHFYYPCLKWLVQDIERFFSCFITSCKGPIREKLIEKSLELNRIAHGIELNFFLKTSVWVTPELRNASVQDVLGAYPNAPFYQPLCASFVLDGPPQFQDIMNDKQTNVLDLVYEEPLAVMMLRFDSLLLLGQQDAERKLCKLGVVILQRLLNVTSKFTIVSPGANMHGVSKKKKEMVDDTLPSSPKRPRLDGDDVGFKEQNGDPEISDNEWQSLSEANVSYCLLYICYALYQIPNMVVFCDLELSVVMNATLRALEMGRYRCFAPEDSLSSKEYSWLTRMENTIEEKFADLQSSSNQNVQLQQKLACQLYSAAVREKGVAFYGNQLAVKLIKTLIQQESVLDPELRLRLYGDVLCSSSEPFMNLNIPEKVHYDHTNKGDLKSIYGFFFEKLFENSSEKQEPIRKVLQHLEVSKDIEFIEMGVKMLKDRMKSLNNDFKPYVLRFVLHGIQQYIQSGSDKYNMNTHETFKITKEAAKDVHVHDCLTHLLSAWEDVAKFFFKFQVSEIACIIGDRIKGERENLSPNTFAVLLQHVTAKFMHNEDVCQILQGLATDSWRHTAIREIIKNHENYSPIALMKLAKIEHDIQSVYDIVEEREVKADIFSENVYELVIRALDGEKLKNEPDSENDSPIELCHLEWCFSALANCTFYCYQFYEIAERLSTCGSSPDVLVGFLDKIADSPPLSDHVKSLFGDRLLSSYYIEFEGRLRNYYGPSCYKSILGDMSKARRNCIKYVENGGPLFQTKVVVPIRRTHKGKRKFLRLMNTDFKDILEETDN